MANLRIENNVDVIGDVKSNGQKLATEAFVGTQTGANTTLSNLIGPTSVNQSLLPDVSNSRNLGSSTKLWGEVFTQVLRDSTGNARFNLAGASNTIIQTTQNTGTIELNVGSGTGSGFITVYAVNGLRLFSGNSFNYVGLRAAGLATSTTYTLPLVDGTSGQFLQTNGLGQMTWASAGGGGANTTLSNLTNTIAIPDTVHLLPANAGAVNLGSSTKAFGSLFVSAWNINNGVDNTNALANLSLPSGGLAAFGIRVNGVDNTFGLITASVNNAGGSGKIRIESGNNGAGISGDIILQTGTASTTRGNILLNGRNINFTSSQADFTTSVAATAAGGAIISARTTANVSAALLGNFNPTSTPAIIALDFSGATNPSFAVATTTASTGSSGELFIQTGQGPSSGNLNILTKPGTAGTSGNITLETGTATTTRGTIRLVDASLATSVVGYVWTLTNITTGAGQWQAAGGGGANTSLSNLTATSITQNLNPAAGNTYDLGATVPWRTLNTRNVLIYNPSGTQIGRLEGTSRTIPSGAASTVNLISEYNGGYNGALAVYSFDDATANAVATGSLYFESGNKTAGTGNSGAISLRTGTSIGGTRGNISLDAPQSIFSGTINPAIGFLQNIGGITTAWTSIYGSNFRLTRNSGGGVQDGVLTSDGAAVVLAAVTTNHSIQLQPNGTGTVQVSNKRITQLLAGTALSDAVNKSQMDDAILYQSIILGEAFAGADGITAVRYMKAADAGFVAGRVVTASNTPASANNYYAIGLVFAGVNLPSGFTTVMVKDAQILTKSAHGYTIGEPVYIGTTGTITSTKPTASGSAVVQVGIVKDANNIQVQIQFIGII